MLLHWVGLDNWVFLGGEMPWNSLSSEEAACSISAKVTVLGLVHSNQPWGRELANSDSSHWIIHTLLMKTDSKNACSCNEVAYCESAWITALEFLSSQISKSCRSTEARLPWKHATLTCSKRKYGTFNYNTEVYLSLLICKVCLGFWLVGKCPPSWKAMGRDGHKPAHRCKFLMNLGQFVVDELKSCYKFPWILRWFVKSRVLGFKYL